MHKTTNKAMPRHPSAAPFYLLLVTVLAAGAWVPAAAQTAAPAAAPAVVLPDAPMTTVTIIERLPRRFSSVVRGLSSTAASSCAYDFSASRAEAIDDYLDSFHGKDRLNDGTESALLAEGDTRRTRRFSDNSPYGDASDIVAARIAGMGWNSSSSDGRRVNSCRQSDYNMAAGRNQIARRDKTLNQGYAAYDSGDYPRALALFRTSYNKVGWDEAALMLGTMYQAGQGTAKDPKEAISWYTKLAHAPLNRTTHYSKFNPRDPERATARVEAQVRLAEMYMSGQGVPRDPSRARAWYKAAEKLDYVPARFTLGQMMASGYGGPRDMAAAFKLYKSAAEEDYVPAQMALARLYKAGAGVAPNPQAAFTWFGHVALSPRAGRHKPFAQYEVARAYDEGVGVKADPDRTISFYKAAAIAGHPAAQNALATYFYNGQQVARDLPVARKLFLTAASQGQDDAMVNVAAMLAKGEGGQKDSATALAWLKVAAQMGNERAVEAAPVLEKSLTPEEREHATAILAGGKTP